MNLYHVFVIFVIIHYSLLHDVQASPVIVADGNRMDTSPDNEIYKNNVELPRTIRSESIDGILGFEPLNSKTDDDKITTLIGKLSLYDVSDIIKDQQQRKNNNYWRYISPVRGMRERKRYINFSYLDESR